MSKRNSLESKRERKLRRFLKTQENVPERVLVWLDRETINNNAYLKGKGIPHSGIAANLA